jgi:hypothetical protein
MPAVRRLQLEDKEEDAWVAPSNLLLKDFHAVLKERNPKMGSCSPFEGEAPFEEPEMELVKKAAAVGTLLGDGGDSYL